MTSVYVTSPTASTHHNASSTCRDRGCRHRGSAATGSSAIISSSAVPARFMARHWASEDGVPKTPTVPPSP